MAAIFTLPGEQDTSNLDLELYPGQSRVIQFVNPDKTPFAISPDTVLFGRVANVLKEVVADLTPTVNDATQGKVQITLPDTATVRSHVKKPLYYDLLLQRPGVQNFLPTSRLKIEQSLSLFYSSAPIVSTTPTPTPTATPSSTPTVPGDIAIAAFEMYSKSLNKVYMFTVENDGTLKPTIQLQEVV